MDNEILNQDRKNSVELDNDSMHHWKNNKHIRKIGGVGINDAVYNIVIIINGKRTVCPYYVKWNDMLRRCYSKKTQKKYPTYIGCVVCDEWKYFTNFRLWMSSKDWKNKELDKDILVPGNKEYSPKACIFVSREINALLTDSKASRGLYPTGIHWHKQHNKYEAKISKGNKRYHLGLFDTVKEAEIVYLKAKAEHIKEIALKQEDQDLMYALLRHVIRLNKEIKKVKNNEDNK